MHMGGILLWVCLEQAGAFSDPLSVMPKSTSFTKFHFKMGRKSKRKAAVQRNVAKARSEHCKTKRLKGLGLCLGLRLLARPVVRNTLAPWEHRPWEDDTRWLHSPRGSFPHSSAH